jgi:hypothetical protein
MSLMAASEINTSSENTNNNLLTAENSNFLAADGDTEYYWKFEGNNSVLYSADKNKSNVKRLAVFPSVSDGNEEPVLNAVIDFGICGDWIIASVGHYEGTGNYFYGDFVRMKKDGSKLEHFWLTDDDTFVIVDDWIYYNFWTVKGDSDEGVYRIRPDGTDNEYMGDILNSIFLYCEDGYVYGEHDNGKTVDGSNPITDLIRCRPDGSELVTLFSADTLPMFDDSDYMRYSDVAAGDAAVTFTVGVHGYADGDIGYGHYCYIADYRVNKDGGGLTMLHEEYPKSEKEKTSPVYSTESVSDENGLTDDTIYSFPSGAITATPEDTLFMVNGEFVPYLLEIRDNRSLMPADLAAQVFGATVDWDDSTKIIAMTLGDTKASVAIGEQFAEVYKDGAAEKRDLYTPAILIDDLPYVPICALADVFDKAVGYETINLAHHPFVWVDERTPEWQPDIQAIQGNCLNALELLKGNFETVHDGVLGKWTEGSEGVYAEIKQKIDDMKVLRYIGRYAFVDGPHAMLVDQNGTVYFQETGYLIWTIYKADFNDPETFMGYYAG